MNRSITKTITHCTLWTAGIILSLLLIVQILLTPRVLTPFIEKYAAHFVDADVSFDRVSVNVFRNFPNISITIDSCTITYSSDKFAELTSQENLLLPSLKGCSRDMTGVVPDTLASMAEFRASVNPFALLAHKMRIKQIAITDLKGYAHRYDSSSVNWIILKNIDNSEDSPDTESHGALPVPIIGRISINGHPRILFTDEVSKTVALVTFSSFDLKGNRDSDRDLLRDFHLRLDSLIVFGSMNEDSAALNLRKVRLMSTGESGIAGEVSADLFSSSKAHGRLLLPVDFSLKADLPSVQMDTLSIESLKGNICGLPFIIKGEARFNGDSLFVNAAFDMSEGDIGYIAEEYGSQFMEFLKNIRTDAVMDIHAQTRGYYSKSSGAVPEFKINLSVPESSIFIGDSDTAAFHLYCRADNFSKGQVNLTLDTLSISALGSTNVNISGKLNNLLSDDPLIHLNFMAAADLSPWSEKIGSDTTFRAAGQIQGDLNGNLKLSQLKLPDLWSADLGARFLASGLKFRMPGDSIDIWSDTVKFVFGAKANEYIQEIAKGDRVLSAGASVDTAFVRYKDEFEISMKEMKIRCHNDASLLSHSNKLPQYFADISASRLSLMDSDSSKITLRGTQNTMKLVRKEKNDSIPAVTLSSHNRFMFLQSRGGRVAVTGLNLNFYAEKFIPGSRSGRASGTHRNQVPQNTGADDDFASSDINFSLGDSFKKLYRQWVANGYASFKSARISTPMFPLKTSISKFGLSFSNNTLSLDSLTLKTGETKIDMSGKISGLRRALMTRGTAEADFRLNAGKMDINELIAALAVGSATQKTTVISDDVNPEISSNEIRSTAEDLKSPLIVIPGNVKATVDIVGKDISISKMIIDSLSTVIEMQDRCVKFSHISAGTSVGDMTFEGYYATRTKKDISLGFNLGLSRITAAEVISMLPHVDSIMPLLKSFDGELQCYMAGTARLDTNMNILPPTLKGVIRFGGHNLSLGQTPEVKKVSRLLMFKNKNDFNIETMSVEAQLDESRIEVFPFLLKIDRYSVAASGVQNLDQSCRYHLSVIRSPLPFRLGLDIYGDNFDKLHYKLVKPKYKSEEKIPVFSKTIDETRLNLSKMISNIFTIGVDKARNDTTILDNIDKRKSDISYVAAQDSKSEAFSDNEISKMQSEAEKQEEQ